jgi:hypothetical protein
MVMSTAFSAPLLASILRAAKTHAVFEHAVQNEKHEMSHRGLRAFHLALALAAESVPEKQSPACGSLPRRIERERFVSRDCYELFVGFCIPALSRLPGHKPAQLAICSAVGKAAIGARQPALECDT